MNWLGRTALGLGQKGLGLFTNKTTALKEAVRTGRMTTDEALDQAGKSSGFFGSTLKWGGLAAGGEYLLRGKDGIVGGAMDTAWTNIGQIEANQNAVGKWQGLFKHIQEFLHVFGIQSDFVDNYLETHGKNKSDFTNLRESISDHPKTAIAAGAGALAVGYGAHKLINGGGSINGNNINPFQGPAQANGTVAGPKSSPSLTAGGTSVSNTVKATSNGLLSRIGSSLKGFGRFGKIAATVGTVAVGAAGVTVAATGGAEASTGDLSVSHEEAASANPSLIENATNGAHAFAHGFVEEISTTGAGIAGHLADAGDWAFGKAASAVGVDTGFANRNLSQSWSESAQGLADSALGAPDLSGGFARAMHQTGGVASWFVGPIAFGGAKLANAGASVLSKSFAAAGAGTRAQGIAGFTGGIAAPGVAFATIPTVGQP